MFQVTCPEVGVPTLRGARALRAMRSGPEGVVLLAACRCGGMVRLRRGVQEAHWSLAELEADASDQMRGASV